MANVMDAAGWRKMFELGADNPQSWRASAEVLLRGARAVGSDLQSGPAGTTDLIVRVQAMLIGMSIECSLKALWLKQGRRYENGTGFLQNGKLVRGAMKGAAHHDLRMMATTVHLSDVAELELLERLSWFVVWVGRYPVPGTAEQTFPKNFKHKGQVMPSVINVADSRIAVALAERLLEEAKPWK